VHRPRRYPQQLGGFQNAQELYRPIILNCRHIPSNLPWPVFSKLQLDLTPSQFPPSFPLATGLRPRDSEGSAFNFFNPDHPIHHCVGSVGCSPYLSIREISMRTLCRCLHCLHMWISSARLLHELCPSRFRHQSDSTICSSLAATLLLNSAIG